MTASRLVTALCFAPFWWVACGGGSSGVAPGGGGEGEAGADPGASGGQQTADAGESSSTAGEGATSSRGGAGGSSKGGSTSKAGSGGSSGRSCRSAGTFCTRDIADECCSGACDGDSCCGFLGDSCPDGHGCCSGSCIDGTCQCPPGTLDCGGNGVCVGIEWNDNACGDCNTKCGVNALCEMGQCICDPNLFDAQFYEQCPGGCFNTHSDNAHCGDCKTVCAGGTASYSRRRSPRPSKIERMLTPSSAISSRRCDRDTSNLRGEPCRKRIHVPVAINRSPMTAMGTCASPAAPV